MKWEVFAQIAQSIGGFSGKVRSVDAGMCGKVGKESRVEGMKKPCPNLDVDQLGHGSYLS